MRRLISLMSTALMLTACGTPQEQCIARETRDLRVVNGLIAEAEGNLKRGYAFEEVEISRTVWVTCAPIPVPPPAEGEPAPPPPQPRMCLDDRDETITRPVAIDLAAEDAKLRGLQAKRKQLTRAADPAIAACRRAYPE